MKLFSRLFCCLSILLLLWGCNQKELPSATVFITTDTGGVFWPRPEPRYGNEVVGGLAILKSFLDKQTEPFLLLEGGNWFAQTPEGTLSKGAYWNDLSAGLPYSARLFTQQDLVYGWNSLSKIVQDSPAPFVLSNITLTNGKLPAGIKPWMLLEVNGYKIGIIGLVNQQTIQKQQRLSNLQVENPLKSVSEKAALLRLKGAQAIIVLSALTVSDQNSFLDETLVEEGSDVDIIIRAGIDSENADVAKVGKTWLIYPGSRLDSVGKIQLFFHKNGELADVRFTDVVLYRRDFGEDAGLAEQILQLRETTRGQMVRTVGSSESTMSGRLDGESVLGNWAADCLRKWAKADAAIVNSSSLRASLPAGKVTQYDLYNLYPYNDNVTYLTLKGKSLLRALEEGLSVPDNFAQISGLQIRYTSDAPVGKRILSVKINGVPLVLSNTYRVAITDYMLAGGAGHDGFIDSLEFKNTQVEMRTVLRLCLAGSKPVSAPALGRWSMTR